MPDHDLLAVMLIAFAGSFGHCIGMCGGIVIAYTSTKVQSRWSRAKQATAHLIYAAGRIFTYVLMGVLFGALGGVVTLTPYGNGTLLLFAGIVMILAGISLLGKIRFLSVIEHSLSHLPWYQKAFRGLMQQHHWRSFFLLGMLNGLLPCGFVYFFAVAAAGSGSAEQGALIMLVFGLSTLPALFGLGFFVGLFQKFGFRNAMIRIAAVAVIAYGVMTLYYAVRFYQNPGDASVTSLQL